MSFARITLLAVLFVGTTLLAQPANPAKVPAKPTREQIARWVTQLGDNDFNLREEASQKLWEAGDIAESALQGATKSDDVEVSRRARDVLEKFKWGIYPSTPKPIVELIGRYQAAQPNEKAAVISDLINAGRDGCKSLIKIASVESDPMVKSNVQAQIALQLSRILPALLAENDFVTLDALVAAGMEADSRAGMSNAAGYWLLRDQLEQKIAHYKALEGKGTRGKENAEILVFLYRARGDLASALAAAKQAERTDLVESLLAEAGDWKELAPPHSPWPRSSNWARILSSETKPG